MELHRAAMKGAVLLDEAAAVDAHNLAVGESLANNAQGLCIKIGLGIGRYQYGIVDDQKVGIGGRQAVAMLIIRCTLFIVIDGSGERQAQ